MVFFENIVYKTNHFTNAKRNKHGRKKVYRERKFRTYFSNDTSNQKEPRKRSRKLLHHLRLHGSHLVDHYLHVTLHDPRPLVVGRLVPHVPAGNYPCVQGKKEHPDRRHLHRQHGQ